ncbi:hypothetical protein ACFWTE_05740 [Nocardiopsis sp. NPDC058631]|uniref:hypothetical protein n=1 Tax=Nocardiopsis sp. NPDC058631 TaxID=3346566 RepID=UPI00365AFD15
MPEPEHTADGRYVVIRGRRWRASDPSLPDREREDLVSHLMSARRDVAAALRARDPGAERLARARVTLAKEGLGERGTPWWEQDGDARRHRWEEALRRLGEPGATGAPP